MLESQCRTRTIRKCKHLRESLFLRILIDFFTHTVYAFPCSALRNYTLQLRPEPRLVSNARGYIRRNCTKSCVTAAHIASVPALGLCHIWHKAAFWEKRNVRISNAFQCDIRVTFVQLFPYYLHKIDSILLTKKLNKDSMLPRCRRP